MPSVGTGPYSLPLKVHVVNFCHNQEGTCQVLPGAIHLCAYRMLRICNILRKGRNRINFDPDQTIITNERKTHNVRRVLKEIKDILHIQYRNSSYNMYCNVKINKKTFMVIFLTSLNYCLSPLTFSAQVVNRKPIPWRDVRAPTQINLSS